jgi:GntR family transcriptional regulator
VVGDNEASRVQIDYESGEKVYLQIARIIRDQIISGELPVGAQIPSGNQMKQEWGVNRLTGAQAVEELRKAGLVITKPGVGTFVAVTPELQVVKLCPGDQVIARMPTEEERERLSTGYLTPVLVVTRSDGSVQAYNAAVTVCESSGLSGRRTVRSRPRDGRRHGPFRLNFRFWSGGQHLSAPLGHRGGAVHLVHVPLAAQQRGDRGDQAGGDREVERDLQALAERSGDQAREERVAGQVGGVASRQLGQHRAEQHLDGVVTEQCGEHDRGRRQVG